MTLAEDFEDFIKLLNLHGVEYMVVGGYALAFHGKPRHTGDLDIWINISEDNALRMLRVVNDFGLKSLGFSKSDFLTEGLISQIGYPPLRIDVLNLIDGVKFEEAFRELQRIELEDGLSINYIGLNDLIKNKQASGRRQDRTDVKTLLKLKK
ncbi:MAG TPA: nucleotidyltransferase [Pedobacter sp.]|nr:nucleotidyltransferase [Pedobacter sp.]